MSRKRGCALFLVFAVAMAVAPDAFAKRRILARKNNILFYDYSRLLDMQGMFADTDHLNKAGAIVMTKQLTSDLASAGYSGLLK